MAISYPWAAEKSPNHVSLDASYRVGAGSVAGARMGTALLVMEGIWNVCGDLPETSRKSAKAPTMLPFVCSRLARTKKPRGAV